MSTFSNGAIIFFQGDSITDSSRIKGRVDLNHMQPNPDTPSGALLCWRRESGNGFAARQQAGKLDSSAMPARPGSAQS
jgi:hypothetical protein